MTEGCAGCTASALGGTGVPHMEECKKRVEAKMKNDPEQLKRMKDAKLKQKIFVDKFMLKQGAPNGDDVWRTTI
jgi:hypothetical protein